MAIYAYSYHLYRLYYLVHYLWPYGLSHSGSVHHGNYMSAQSKERPRFINQQQLFSSLANNALVGVAIIQNNRFSFVNRQFAQLVGYERSQLLKMGQVHSVFGAYDTVVEQFIQGQKELLIEEQFTHFSGRKVDVEVCFIRTHYDETLVHVLFVLDISQRKESERSAQIAGLVYENTGEAIVVTDENGLVVDVNPAFCEITGYELPEIVGRSMNILSSGRHSTSFYRKMWQQLRTTGRWQGDLWNRRKSGEEYAERLNISTCYNDDGSVYRRIGLFFDVTTHKEREEGIWRQANYDHLTELPNRQLFQTRLQQAMQDADENNKAFALIFLDLDLFKDVNDTFGHDIGDLLLREAAKRLLSCVRDESDTVARIGGDEFTVIVTNVTDQKIVNRICEDILKAIAQPYYLGDGMATVSASIGITMYPEDASDASELLKNADMAMYGAKDSGRNQYCYFIPAMSEAIQARMMFSESLQRAIDENQFILYYQPIVDMRTGQVVKYEALIRWQHPELGLVPPSEYIPFAEDSGLIVGIGNWVFKAVLEQAKIWYEEGREQFISLNVSPAQFYADGVQADDWINLIKEVGVPTQMIVIEITERLLLENNPVITQILQQFREAGLRIALDDFGTGFSSLTYLKRYPIDIIKIDQSFVRNLASESEDLALCEAMIVMAKKLGLEVIAEGVEGPEQEKLLLEAGCAFGQGYLYSRPVTVQDLDRWVLERKRNAIKSNTNDPIMTGPFPTKTYIV